VHKLLVFLPHKPLLAF